MNEFNSMNLTRKEILIISGIVVVLMGVVWWLRQRSREQFADFIFKDDADILVQPEDPDIGIGIGGIDGGIEEVESIPIKPLGEEEDSLFAEPEGADVITAETPAPVATPVPDGGQNIVFTPAETPAPVTAPTVTVPITTGGPGAANIVFTAARPAATPVPVVTPVGGDTPIVTVTPAPVELRATEQEQQSLFRAEEEEGEGIP